MRKKTSLLAIGLILSTLLTGCTQEDIINNGSKLIADLITSTLESEKEPITREAYYKEDEPEIIEQYIETDECWKNGIYYYFNQLTPEQQTIYNQLYETVETMSESTTLNLESGMTSEDISIIYRALRYDHPEIYWIQAYKYIVDGNNMYFYPTYLVNTEEKSLYDNQLEDWTDGIIKTVDKDWSDYEKELALYDYIVENTEYNLSAPLNQSLISVVQGESVCLGYTKAFKYLCDKVGLECIVVEGISKDGVGHSWNKVKIGEDWYNVDATNSSTAQIFSDSYDMFNITDDLINIRYTETLIGDTGESTGESNIVFGYPIANSIEADYYNMKGLYINSLEEIEDVVNNHIKDGTVTIRLSPECDMKEELQEYMKHIDFKDSQGNAVNMKCLNYVTINYIRLLEINWC